MISVNCHFLDLLNSTDHYWRAPYTRKQIELGAALEEVVREAGLMALKPKQLEATEGIVSGKITCHVKRKEPGKEPHCGRCSLTSLRSGS